MTAQISDRFEYHECEFDITDISDNQSFDLSFLNLSPSMTSTACWNGYQAVFGISNDKLVLNSLYVNLIQKDQEGRDRRLEGHAINGVAPRPDRRAPPSIYYEEEFNNYYYDLALPLDFTGGMLVADGFVKEGWGYSGFASAWHYEVVFELIFEAGKLRAELDHSVVMASIRDKVLPRRSDLSWSEQHELVQQLADTSLSRKYHFKG